MSTFRVCRQFRSLSLASATAAIRMARFDGVEHVVVPTILLVEGVIWPMNAPKPELVLSSEFSRSPLGWNGEPVLPDHPILDGERVSANIPKILESMQFGRLFETAIKAKQLVSEAWLNPTQAKRVGKQAESVIERARAGEPIEISVGAFTVLEEAEGIYAPTETPYYGIWRDIVPDHLAMLPEGIIGACSNEMGCGAPRAARVYLVTAAGGLQLVVPPDVSPKTDAGPPNPETPKVAEEHMPADTKRSLRDRIKEFVRGFRGAQEEDVSDADLRRTLDAAIRAEEPGYLYIDSVFPGKNEVVYCVAPEEEFLLYQRGYTVGEDGAASLANDRVEVKQVTRYEPVTAAAAPTAEAGTAEAAAKPPAAAAACDCHKTPQPVAASAAPSTSAPRTEGEIAMKSKQERIRALVESPKKVFTAAHQAILETMTDEQLAKAEETDAAAQVVEEKPAEAKPEAKVEAKPEAKAEDKPVEPKVEAEQPKAAAQMTEAEVLKAYPTIGNIVAQHQAREAARKTTLVASLKSAQSEFTEVELNARSVDELERLARMAKAAVPEVDYSGAGTVKVAAKADEGDGVPAPIDMNAAIRAARGIKDPAGPTVN